MSQPPPPTVQAYRGAWAEFIASVPAYDDGGTGERKARVATLQSLMRDEAEVVAWLVVLNRDVVGPALDTWYADEVAGDLREIQATLALEHRYSLQRVAIEHVEGKLRGDVAKAAATARRSLESSQAEELQRVRHNDAAKAAMAAAEAGVREAVETTCERSWQGLVEIGRRWLAEVAVQARQRDEHAAAVREALLIPSLVAAEVLVRDAIERCRDRTVEAIRQRYPSAAGCPRFCARSVLSVPALWASAMTPGAARTQRRLECHSSPWPKHGPKYIERDSDDLETLRETLSDAARRDQRRGVRRRRESALVYRRHVVGPARDLGRLVARLRLGYAGRAALFAKHAALIKRKRAVLAISAWYVKCLGRREAWRRVRALLAAQHEAQRRQLQFERYCVDWEMTTRVQTVLRARESSTIAHRRGLETADACARRLQRFLRWRLARAALRRRFYGWQVRDQRHAQAELQRDAATRIAAHWRRWLAVREYRQHALAGAEQRRVAGNVRELFEHSVTIVQAAYRRVMAQRDAAALAADATARTAMGESAEVTRYCAVEVQRVFRGHQGRRWARHLRARKIQREIERLSAQLHDASRGGLGSPSTLEASSTRGDDAAVAAAATATNGSSAAAGNAVVLQNNSKMARAERLRRAILATQHPAAAAVPDKEVPVPEPLANSPAVVPTPKRGWARVSRVLLGATGAATRRRGAGSDADDNEAAPPTQDTTPSPQRPPTSLAVAPSSPPVPVPEASPFFSIIGLVRSRAERPGDSIHGGAKTARNAGRTGRPPASVGSVVGASGAAAAVQVVARLKKQGQPPNDSLARRQRPRSATGPRRVERSAPSDSSPYRAGGAGNSGGMLTSDSLRKHRQYQQAAAAETPPLATGPPRRAASKRIDPTADVGAVPLRAVDTDDRRISGNRAVVAAALLRKAAEQHQQQAGNGIVAAAERRRASASDAGASTSSVPRPQLKAAASVSTLAGTTSSVMADSLRDAVERQRRHRQQQRP